MHHTICYFSATGNSLAVTRQIAGALGDCAIRSMTAEPPDEPVGGAGNSVGFVFPAHYFDVPRLVVRYIERLNILPGTYCFALVTYRGAASDRFALDRIAEMLQKKGVSLSYAAGTPMPGTYVLLYEPPLPDQVQELVRHAGHWAQTAANDIARGVSYRDPSKRPWIFRMQKRAIRLYIMIDRAIRKPFGDAVAWDKKFTADDRCTGCGICAGVCPVDNITMTDGRPVWRYHCERCLACIHWCPCESIQHGKITVGRRRYHHPEIKPADIIHLTASSVKRD